MKEGTLWLVYICKYFELLFLLGWTIFMIIEGVQYLERVNKAKKSGLVLANLVMVPICMLLAVLNLLYNNLFINIRFKCKICCKTFGICVFDVINFLMGYCCLKRFCRDKCFEWPTLLKWFMKFGIFGYTCSIVWMQDKAMKEAATPINLISKKTIY